MTSTDGRVSPASAACGRPAPQPSGASLSAELEAALLRELVRTWRELNASLFHDALTPPVMRLSRGVQTLGRWDLRRRAIELSVPLVMTSSWGSVVEVLKHEMAHQYADEVLEATSEPAHGPAFCQVCERLGLRPQASAAPDEAAEADPQRGRMLKRVADLLALADSPNLHEAKTAAAVAQRLMLKHNIELATRPGRQRYAYRHVGRPSGRVPESEHILAAILAEHFFVEAIWVPAYRPEDGQRGSLLELCGTPENLEIACYAHAFLRGTAERLWAEHRRAHGLRSNRDRRTFVAGVMEGFRERLVAEKRRCREQGLVWVGDADLKTYHRQRHPHVRHVRLLGHHRNQARADGREAGRRIVLRRALGEDHRAEPARHKSVEPRCLPSPADGGSRQR